MEIKKVKFTSIDGEVSVMEDKIIGLFPPNIFSFGYVLLIGNVKILVNDAEYYNLKNHYFKK